jgi:death-on-curing protein
VREPEWLELDLVLEIQRLNLLRYGGASGIRDLGLLQSALARPQWLHEFDATADLHRLAASYANGIVRNHPFVDGNKRTGFISAYTFLRFNGWYLTATDPDAVRSMLALAAGTLTEEQFAAWLRHQSEAVPWEP